MTSSLMRKYKSIEKIRAKIDDHRETELPQKNVSTKVMGSPNIVGQKKYHVPQPNKKWKDEKQVSTFMANNVGRFDVGKFSKQRKTKICQQEK